MNTDTKILIVEDDTDINNILATALKKEGYASIQVFSGTEAKLMLELKKGEFSLVLLDLMLPGVSGEEVLEEIRKEGEIPVIVLTAKDSLDNKLSMLTGGADDYITKPFDIKEVIARVQIQLRHAQKQNGTVDIAKQQIKHKKMLLDKSDFSITIGDVTLSKITKQEFAILELLMRNPKQVFSKEAIFEYAWEEPYIGETKTLDVHISNIRKKIRTVTEEEYIETVWGIGYRAKA